MLVGIFFSEFGYELLSVLAGSDMNIQNISINFNEYKSTENTLENYHYMISCEKHGCARIKSMLIENQALLITLMSNDNLYEHEVFSGLLLATVHLRDEYLFRNGNGDYSETDLAHINKDTEKVYRALVLQWWDYLEHLRQAYPYLYMLAKAKNPFVNGKR